MNILQDGCGAVKLKPYYNKACKPDWGQKGRAGLTARTSACYAAVLLTMLRGQCCSANLHYHWGGVGSLKIRVGGISLLSGPPVASHMGLTILYSLTETYVKIPRMG
jgi:hypothetical protein